MRQREGGGAPRRVPGARGQARPGTAPNPRRQKALTRPSGQDEVPALTVDGEIAFGEPPRGERLDPQCAPRDGDAQRELRLHHGCVCWSWVQSRGIDRSWQWVAALILPLPV